MAVPSGLVPAGTLPVDPSKAEMVGPHTPMQVPRVRMSDVGMEHLGIDISLQVVDLGVGALRALTPLLLVPVPESEDQCLIGFGEDLNVILDPAMTLLCWQKWSTG